MLVAQQGQMLEIITTPKRIKSRRRNKVEGYSSDTHKRCGGFPPRPPVQLGTGSLTSLQLKILVRILHNTDDICSSHKSKPNSNEIRTISNKDIFWSNSKQKKNTERRRKRGHEKKREAKLDHLSVRLTHRSSLTITGTLPFEIGL